jgi:hypothetical protein
MNRRELIKLCGLGVVGAASGPLVLAAPHSDPAVDSLQRQRSAALITHIRTNSIVEAFIEDYQNNGRIRQVIRSDSGEV